MDEVKSTYDIDNALESTAGIVVDIDTVAIWDNEEKMYGIYVKGEGEALWWLTMTSFTVDKLMK